jgi:hypothetical protein
MNDDTNASFHDTFSHNINVNGDLDMDNAQRTLHVDTFAGADDYYVINEEQGTYIMRMDTRAENFHGVSLHTQVNGYLATTKLLPMISYKNKNSKEMALLWRDRVGLYESVVLQQSKIGNLDKGKGRIEWEYDLAVANEVKSVVELLEGKYRVGRHILSASATRHSSPKR